MGNKSARPSHPLRRRTILSVFRANGVLLTAGDLLDFRTGFAHTLRRMDRLQPALLAVCLGSTIGLASSTGAARTLAALAAGVANDRAPAAAVAALVWLRAAEAMAEGAMKLEALPILVAMFPTRDEVEPAESAWTEELHLTGCAGARVA